jgi:hypothetical protein
MKRKKDHEFNPFQIDLMQNRFHIFDADYARTKGFYPNEVLEIISKLTGFNRDFKIEIGEIYAVRAFFVISDPMDNEVEFESGYLDVKLLLKETDIYVGEVVTVLPPSFVLKKGSKIKLTKANILYKPDYSHTK